MAALWGKTCGHSQHLNASLKTLNPLFKVKGVTSLRIPVNKTA